MRYKKNLQESESGTTNENSNADTLISIYVTNERVVLFESGKR